MEKISFNYLDKCYEKFRRVAKLRQEITSIMESGNTDTALDDAIIKLADNTDSYFTATKAILQSAIEYISDQLYEDDLSENEDLDDE